MSDDATLEISIFLEAIKKQPGDELAAYLDGACGEDPELRQVVEALVEKHHQGESFLERPAIAVDQTVDVNRSALDAGLAPAFGADEAVVVGGAGHSVLKSISQHLPRTPHVVLRENQAEEGRVAQATSAELPTADSDSRYQLHGEIARGGMGAIIKGRDTDLGRDLAIKVLLESHRDKPDVMQRFVEEAQIGGQLQHPGIVPVYELGQFGDSRPFFTMKLVKGQTLAALLSKRKDPADDRPKLLGIFEQVCQTMAYAHSKGVIHRDLKPANIMVGAFGEVQVMDWGLAKVLGVGGVEDEQRSLDKHRDVSVIQTRRSTGSDAPGEVGSQTQMGSVMGTPAYMPPEQALGEIDRLDARADVFGLGAILTEILTGKPPYVAEDSTRVFRMASRGSLDDCFSRLEASGADPELTELVRTALSLEPDDRFEDAGELAEKVTQHLEGVQDRLKAAEIGRAKAQTRRKLLAAIAGVLLIFGVAAAMAAFRFNQLADKQTKLAIQNEKLALAAAEGRDKAVAEAQRTNVVRLTAQAEALSQQHPIKSLLLAVESFKLAQEHDRALSQVTFETLANTVPAVGGLPFSQNGRRVEISRDGRWLATGRPLGGVEVWNLAAADFTRPALVVPSEPFTYHFALSADSKLLFTGAVDGRIRLWNLASDQRRMLEPVVIENESRLFGLATTPDGKWLISAGKDARVWDLRNQPITTPTAILKEHEEAVRSLAVSPDNRWLATASDDKTVRLWDLTSEKIETTSTKLDPDKDMTSRMDFSSDGRWLATASVDGTVYLWDLKAESPSESIRVLREHQQTIGGIKFSADSRWLITGSRDETVRFWDLSDLSASSRTLRANSSVLSLAISPNGRWLVTGTLQHQPQLWDLSASDSNQRPLDLRGHEQAVGSLAISPDGRWLVTGSWEGVARLWDLTSHNPASPRVLRGHRADVVTLATDPSGRWLVTGSVDNTARLWDLERPAATPRVLTGHEDDIVASDISPNGRWLATAALDGTARLWDLHVDGPLAPTRIVRHDGAVRCVVFSSNSGLLVTGSDDRTARIWEVRAADVDEPAVSVFRGHQEMVGSVAVSQDNRWLATGSKTALLWDLTADDPASSPLVPVGQTEFKVDVARGALGAQVGFSSDNHWLVVGNTFTAGLWDLNAAAPHEAHTALVETDDHWGVIKSLTISPDGRWLAMGTMYKGSRLWHLAAQDPASSLREFPEKTAVIRVLISPDGRWLVAGHEDSTARLWDLHSDALTPSSLLLRGHEGQIDALAMTPDGKWLITASRDNTARLWELDEASLVDRARELAGRELTPLERERFGLAEP